MLWLKAIGVILVSIGLGFAVGMLEFRYCCKYGGIEGAFFGFFLTAVGAIIGFFSSPALVFGLMRGPLLRGLFWIVAPTLVAGIAAPKMVAAMQDPVEELLLLPVVVYIGACVCWGSYAHATYSTGYCTHCGYSRFGLKKTAPCPVCGRQVAPP